MQSSRSSTAAAPSTNSLCCCALSTHCNSPHIHDLAAAELGAMNCCTRPSLSTTLISPTPAPADTETTHASPVRCTTSSSPQLRCTSSKPAPTSATTATRRRPHGAPSVRHMSSVSRLQLPSEVQSKARACARVWRRAMVPRQHR